MQRLEHSYISRWRPGNPYSRR